MRWVRTGCEEGWMQAEREGEVGAGAMQAAVAQMQPSVGGAAHAKMMKTEKAYSAAVRPAMVREAAEALLLCSDRSAAARRKHRDAAVRLAHGSRPSSPAPGTPSSAARARRRSSMSFSSRLATEVLALRTIDEGEALPIVDTPANCSTAPSQRPAARRSVPIPPAPPSSTPPTCRASATRATSPPSPNA